jgi:hypothetical protein
MTDYYHWRTGGRRHHKGGLHPKQLPTSVGKQQRKPANTVDAVPMYPNGRRRKGGTLAQAMRARTGEHQSGRRAGLRSCACPSKFSVVSVLPQACRQPAAAAP